VIDAVNMVDETTIRAGLGKTLDRTDFPALGKKYEGKVRDNYSRGDRRFIVVTDRISAFDCVLPNAIPAAYVGV